MQFNWLLLWQLWCSVQTICRELKKEIHMHFSNHRGFPSNDGPWQQKHRHVVLPSFPSWKKLSSFHQRRGPSHQTAHFWCQASSGSYCIVGKFCDGTCPQRGSPRFPLLSPFQLNEPALLAHFYRKTPPLFGSLVDRGTFKRTIASFSKSINFNGISSVFRTISSHL